ncbi:DDB1- and CUL4-associated factor 11 isoform X1 [Xiphophorus maculatus]|uniref:DDB1- and CUL4-associated factor 11 isoform X1 n=1 Tax=Xiphophorus maculatus TaxID=8083 RepID=UPI000C6EA71E|nr:DDB1- and CUL4-associated factor 11 isoform X1 [Xiphophorus maculatus]
MGSQSSSGMSCGRGSSSGNPADQSEAAEPNQNQNQNQSNSSSSGSSSRGRRTADRQQSDRQSAFEEDVDLAEVLAYLLRRGQVRVVHGHEATGLQLVQSYSDSDEDSDGAWDGRLGDRYNPPVDSQPDTQEVDRSEIRTQILLATASSALKSRHSFTHMLTEREQGRCRGSSFSHGECSRIRTHFLPNYVSHKDTYLQKAFCGLYSEEGNMFLSACQDQNIRLYDTTRGRFHLQRTVKARDVGWSVLDVCFTPDARNVLYSSWSDYIHLCSIDGDSENHTALDLKLVFPLIVTYNITKQVIYHSLPAWPPSAPPSFSTRMNDAVSSCRPIIRPVLPLRVCLCPSVQRRDHSFAVFLIEIKIFCCAISLGRLRGWGLLLCDNNVCVCVCLRVCVCVCVCVLCSPDERRFCVFSLAASTDGKEILGGANDGCLYVFDLEQNKRTLKIDAHEDDVNAVAFADSSSQLLFSGSDDALCKVWDRRTLREDRPQPVGQLAGHRDGITFIHSKGDARYLISNSKDQSIKLWDVRKFSPKEGLAASRLAVTQQNWDYRWQQVPQRALKKHKLTGDTSVMTYRGHGVLHTLIRCRFSPEFSTGQRFIYSGCSTGKIVIYDVLTGMVVSRLSGHDACVRDVSWHPYDDKIISSSWDGAVRMWEHRQTHPLEEEREREEKR